MELWFKYVVTETATAASRDLFQQLDQANSASASPREYLDRYLHHFHNGRVSDLYPVVAKHVLPTDRVLSLASGRCGLELALVDQVGCEMTCSDQHEPPWLAETRRLFPALRWIRLDPVRYAAPGRFDVVLCLGVLYLFSPDDLDIVCAFLAAAVVPGGRVILDVTGARPCLLTRALHEYYLPLEARAMAWRASRRTGRPWIVTRLLDGYRYETADVEQRLEHHGFEIIDHWEGSYATDFMRSRLVSRLVQRWPWFRRVLGMVGRIAPMGRVLVGRRR